MNTIARRYLARIQWKFDKTWANSSSAELMFDPNTSHIDEVNNSISGILSIFGNLSLIYATSKVKIYSNSVRRSQLFTAIIRILFSITVWLGSPTMAYIVEARAVYIVEGGFDSMFF
ncbi:unnamed protein product [Caenorhabditis angaria]|uniref:Uncharacterized protein n=1 Tax=Caenorhabditis angaria TaxID=860376 RepID=A0A9P1IRC6_9PELO|nr:unnamed protein product [Caenorhabditis angaria]